MADYWGANLFFKLSFINRPVVAGDFLNIVTKQRVSNTNKQIQQVLKIVILLQIWVISSKKSVNS